MTTLTKDFLQHYEANREFQFDDIDKLVARAEQQIRDIDTQLAAISQERHERQAVSIADHNAYGAAAAEAERRSRITPDTSDVDEIIEAAKELALLHLALPIIKRWQADTDITEYQQRTAQTEQTLTRNKIEIERQLKALEAEQKLREMESAGPLKKVLSVFKG